MDTFNYEYVAKIFDLALNLDCRKQTNSSVGLEADKTKYQHNKRVIEGMEQAVGDENDE